VEDLDREVLAHLAEDRLLLLLDDLAGAVVRIDDVVAELELDVLDLDLEVVQQGLVDDVADGSVLLV
jgi:ABC-type cobalamin transport system permease subunit